MKVLIMSGVGWGHNGGGQQPEQIARALAAQGHEVTVHCPVSGDRPYPLPRNLVVDEGDPLLGQVMWAAKPDGAEAYWRGNVPIYGEPGVAIITAPIPWLVHAAEVLQDYGWTIVYWVLDDWRALTKGGYWWSEEMERRLVHVADRVIVCADALARSARDRGAESIVSIPNGYDAQVCRPVPHVEDPVSILYSGTTAGWWLDWSILEGIARLRPDWRIHIVGGRPWEESVVKQMLQRHVNMVFHGEVPNRWLCDMSRAANVGIIPFLPGRLSDSVDPIKAYEYLACGLPVVSSRMPQLDGWPATVQLDGDPASWVRAIEAIVRAPFPDAEVEAFLETRSWAARARQFIKAMAPVEAVSV